MGKKSSINLWIKTLLVGMLIMTWGCGDGSNFYSVSGTVKFGGKALSGVTITLSGKNTRTAVTSNIGYYSFADIDKGDGTYTITPSLSGYVFTPASRTVSGTGLVVSSYDFNAVMPAKVATSVHTLFADTDGTVWAWGYNSKGQLGNGTTTNSSNAAQIAGLSGVTAVAAGTEFSMALKSDGTVWAWGDNTDGQLGDGTTTSRTTPVQVSGITDAVAITAGDVHAAALKSDGTILVWGDNTYGQLGNGTVISSALPVQISALTNIVSVSAGYDHTLALQKDGTVWAWGNNSNGQLGNGTTTNSGIPSKSTITGAIQIAAGNKFSAALVYSSAYLTGGVATWGINTVGQLGNGTTQDSLVPGFIGSFTGIVFISAGFNHAVAVKDTGAVWAWGGNASGQLGIGTNVSSSVPVQSGNVVNMVLSSAGNIDTVALKNDGTVWAWGNNTYGQLGDGSTTVRWTPIQVP